MAYSRTDGDKVDVRHAKKLIRFNHLLSRVYVRDSVITEPSTTLVRDRTKLYEYIP